MLEAAFGPATATLFAALGAADGVCALAGGMTAALIGRAAVGDIAAGTAGGARHATNFGVPAATFSGPGRVDASAGIAALAFGTIVVDVAGCGPHRQGGKEHPPEHSPEVCNCAAAGHGSRQRAGDVINPIAHIPLFASGLAQRNTE
jgi:hypothetical protein